MPLKNSENTFGIVTRTLHWAIAGAILVQLPLGLRLENLEPGLANLWLYALHKSLGFIVFALMAIRIVWHLYSPPPAPMGGGWQARIARLAHWVIYALLVIIPLSGWAASSATGLDVMLFDRWVIPPIAPVSERYEEIGFAIHGIATKVLIGLLALHIGAALKREMEGDGTLTRMLTGHR